MPREGKHDRFGRRLCEALKPHLGEDYRYTGAPQHGFRRKTAFGHESVMVHIWGAHAPKRHLEFMLGVWHDKYEATRLQLGIEPTLAGADHFWQTTFNLRGHWSIAVTHEGRWNANLDENPSVLAPEIVPFLADAMHVVFNACADLRTVRELVSQGFNGPLWTSEPWRQIAIIDAALRDWRHLAGFIRNSDLPFSASKDMNLIKGIQTAFDFEFAD